jgi:gamma-glutamyltranspeptidase / glutathione hydrolase
MDIQWQKSEDFIRNASPNGHEMLLDGKAPLPGQIMRFQNLAKTFRALAEHGKDGFYKGRIAEAIVEVIKSKGGVMELEDLAKHTSDFVEPIRYTYGGEVTVYEVTQAQLYTRPATLNEYLLVPSKWTR